MRLNSCSIRFNSGPYKAIIRNICIKILSLKNDVYSQFLKNSTYSSFGQHYSSIQNKVYTFFFYVLMNSSLLESVLQLSLYKYGFMFSSENINIYEYYCHMKWQYSSFSTFVSSELLCRPFTRLYISPFAILPHITTLHYYLTYLNLLLPLTNVLINCTTFKDFQIISIYVQHKS